VFVADVRKICAVAGWRPQVSAQEGVQRMLEWVNSTIVEPQS
jgi:CDP-paratose 2-epimerase